MLNKQTLFSCNERCFTAIADDRFVSFIEFLQTLFYESFTGKTYHFIIYIVRWLRNPAIFKKHGQFEKSQTNKLENHLPFSNQPVNIQSYWNKTTWLYTLIGKWPFVCQSASYFPDSLQYSYAILGLLENGQQFVQTV